MPTESRRSPFDRLPVFALSIVVAITLFVSYTTPIGVTPIDQGVAPCKMTIQFLEPRDWRCVNEGSDRCVKCLNVSNHFAELAVRCVDQTRTKRWKVPHGGEISVCRGEKAPMPSSL